jgi:hypothetical protein
MTRTRRAADYTEKRVLQQRRIRERRARNLVPELNRQPQHKVSSVILGSLNGPHYGSANETCAVGGKHRNQGARLKRRKHLKLRLPLRCDFAPRGQLPQRNGAAGGPAVELLRIAGAHYPGRCAKNGVCSR